MAKKRGERSAPPPDELSIRMLGAFELSVDGRPIHADAWPTRRARERVQVLALARQHRLSRDRVIDALWPQLEADAAIANLRKAMHFARKALGHARALMSDESSLVLLPHGRIRTDVARFEKAAASALRN